MPQCFASFPCPVPPSNPESQDELNETQRILEHRTPVLTSDLFAPKETFRPLSWCVSQFYDELVLHPGFREATNVQLHERLGEQPGPTSNVEPHLAPRCTPKATTAVAHDPFLSTGVQLIAPSRHGQRRRPLSPGCYSCRPRHSPGEYSS